MDVTICRKLMNNSHPIFTLFLLAILLFISQIQPATASKNSQTYTTFVKTKCNVTTYPPLCQKTLIPYASSVKTDNVRLCKAALKVTIKGASKATSTISKLAKQKGISRVEAATFKDCIYDLKDAVYELKQAVDAMGHLGDKDKAFQWDNAKTYASAVITDADSCNDGFADLNKVSPSAVKKVKSSIEGVTKLASNALSFINHLY